MPPKDIQNKIGNLKSKENLVWPPSSQKLGVHNIV